MTQGRWERENLKENEGLSGNIADGRMGELKREREVKRMKRKRRKKKEKKKEEKEKEEEGGKWGGRMKNVERCRFRWEVMKLLEDMAVHEETRKTSSFRLM